jgi:hypothetical protein
MTTEDKICPICKGVINYRRSINEIADGVSLKELKEKWGCKCQNE